MNDPDRDPDLLTRFARLREEERSAAPDFVLHGLGRPRRTAPFGRWRPVGLLAAGLLLAVVGGLWHHRFVTSGDAVEPALADWRSPTDFLLDTPNRELLTGLPTLGAIPPSPLAERSTAP